MRRAIVLLSTMTVALVLGSGVALGAVKFGTDRHDVIRAPKERT